MSFTKIISLTPIPGEILAKNEYNNLSFREIGRMESSDLSRDTSGTRAFSQFLVELADKIPSHVLPNISLLMAHLDGEVQSFHSIHLVSIIPIDDFK